MREDYKVLPVVQKLSKEEQIVWINQKKIPFAQCSLKIGMSDIDEAEARLQRFAPFIMKCFPETGKDTRKNVVKRRNATGFLCCSRAIFVFLIYGPVDINRPKV